MLHPSQWANSIAIRLERGETKDMTREEILKWIESIVEEIQSDVAKVTMQ